jgi:hypothetical protein
MTINCCGTVEPNKKGIPKNLGKKIKLKQGDKKNKMKENSHSVERQITEGYFCDKHVKALTLAIVLYKTTLHVRATWTK